VLKRIAALVIIRDVIRDEDTAKRAVALCASAHSAGETYRGSVWPDRPVMRPCEVPCTCIRPP
jgi:hypothetical protein